MLKLAGQLDALHERLAGVVIESLPYADFIARYDRPETLFYLDPPYYTCEHFYGQGLFVREDFEQLAATLTNLKGRFILSLNDTPEVRRIFDGFEIEAVETTYSEGPRHGQEGKRGADHGTGAAHHLRPQSDRQSERNARWTP